MSNTGGPTQQELQGRLTGIAKTVSKYEDKSLQEYARSLIPPSVLANSGVQNPYNHSGPNNDEFYYGVLSRDDDLVQSLLRWFKRDFFKWTNKPRCAACNCDPSCMECTGMSGPETDAERIGEASRVEMYSCSKCFSVTRFPRYNNPRTLLSPEGRKGRCGEFANAFTCLLISLGYAARYVYDVTDHVWTEYYSPALDRYVHVDSCEAKHDGEGLYEHGWGKQMKGVYAISSEGLVDVTGKYSRKLKDMGGLRYGNCSREAQDAVVASMDRSLKAKLNPARLAAVQRIEKNEREYMRQCQLLPWGDERCISEGRVSGDVDWKRLRGESGGSKPRPARNAVVDGLAMHRAARSVVPLYLPNPAHDTPLRVTCQSSDPALPEHTFSTPSFNHHAITYCNASSATGLKGLNLVVIHEKNLAVVGSVAFNIELPKADNDDSKAITAAHVNDFKQWLSALPEGRIVLGATVGLPVDGYDRGALDMLSTYFNVSVPSATKGVAFVSTVNRGARSTCDDTTQHSIAKVCVTLKAPALNKQECSGEVCKLTPNEDRNMGLRTYDNCFPQVVECVLPLTVMPLDKQLAATNEEVAKIAGMYVMMNPQYTGYSTGVGKPVFLISAAKGRAQKGWGNLKPGVGYVTVVKLPAAFCPSAPPPAVGQSYAKASLTALLPSTLLANDAPITRTSASALVGKKLILLYFSAHWCGPCRQFTPRLASLYPQISEHVEVIFVSSDRSESDFNSYFSTMPWIALPFSEQFYKQTLSQKCGVRGIPSLCVLDPITGSIVTSNGREDVGTHGAGVVDIWLSQLTSESLDEMDSIDRAAERAVTSFTRSEEDRIYGAIAGGQALSLPPPPPTQKEKQAALAARVKELFAELTTKDKTMDPNAAAAQAIREAKQQIASENSAKMAADRPTQECVFEDTIDAKEITAVDEFLATNDKAMSKSCVETLIKYVSNAMANPSENKYRVISSKNKVFINKIASANGALAMMESLGLGGFEFDPVEEMCVLRISKDLDLDVLLTGLKSIEPE
jgi:thiol-disulfide isomerase/thioredoxin